MPKLKPSTQAARREHILDAAERCFARAGFHRTTMQDICKEAQVSAGALYVYFASKEELIAGISERDRANFAQQSSELACADALSRAMTLSREKHGIFVFSGNTRHRVEVSCLKDFADPHFVDPSSLGLSAGGYTRLGAPIRHLTQRLLDQPLPISQNLLM